MLSISFVNQQRRVRCKIFHGYGITPDLPVRFRWLHIFNPRIYSFDAMVRELELKIAWRRCRICRRVDEDLSLDWLVVFKTTNSDSQWRKISQNDEILISVYYHFVNVKFDHRDIPVKIIMEYSNDNMPIMVQIMAWRRAGDKLNRWWPGLVYWRINVRNLVPIS